MKKIKQLWFLSLGTMLVIFLMVPLIGLAQETVSRGGGGGVAAHIQQSGAIVKPGTVIVNSAESKTTKTTKVQFPQQKVQKVQKTNKATPQKTNNTTRNVLLIMIFLGLGLVIIAIVIKYINNKEGKNPLEK